MGRLSGGISPIAMTLAYTDWLLHLAVSPGKQLELLAAAAAVPGGAGSGMGAGEGGDEGRGSGRFAAPEWQGWPYQAYAQGFLRLQRFWDQATEGVRGVAPHHAEVVGFTARQLLDMCSPANFVWSNPEVLRAAVDSGGRSLADGAFNLLQDLAHHAAPPGMAAPLPAHALYRPGQEVALTPGAVVFRNELIELIQYAPQGASVARAPLLIVPSWIMKFYILDLSPHNSLVRFLVAQGHTVFMMSWRNPGAADRELTMEDYLRRGLLAALAEVARICPGVPVHAAGYCLGGTLLAMGAALFGAGVETPPAPLASLTLLAAQTDFSEPGELGLFIDDSELAMLDALMWEQGYLSGEQMAASFQLLHARDLVWSRMMREYLQGRRSAPNDLMAWNADSTRLPYRMHSDYLHQLFLRNDLAEGRYHIGGAPVLLADIEVPLFVLGTERDHVSPWRSVYKIALLAGAPVDFVLVSGGHNAGIVCEPGHAGHSYLALAPAAKRARYLAPAAWLKRARRHEGSWWPHWQQWLSRHSEGAPVAPPALGGGVTLDPAPGRFVTQA
ncbi:polyhydroxyalkanoic acid synthase [Oxalobacteraceae bacterium]|nr:polyhydroxyalkanoic acid synthase [Oxalobacteraceae bacterium]